MKSDNTSTQTSLKEDIIDKGNDENKNLHNAKGDDWKNLSKCFSQLKWKGFHRWNYAKRSNSSTTFE